MNKNLKTIIFYWGGILALGMIIFQLLIRYFAFEDEKTLKNVLEISELLFTFFCIYKAISAYRKLQGEGNPFPALLGIKASLGVLGVFYVLFFLYFLIFYNFVDTNFVEEFKFKRTELVLQSDLDDFEKEKSIQAVKNLTTTSYIITSMFQRLMFPIIGMLFIVAFMQRKPAKTVEVKNNENQQS
jgi:ABC-type multidrug transport system fused ATPase/permease subunit